MKLVNPSVQFTTEGIHGCTVFPRRYAHHPWACCQAPLHLIDKIDDAVALYHDTNIKPAQYCHNGLPLPLAFCANTSFPHVISTYTP